MNNPIIRSSLNKALFPGKGAIGTVRFPIDYIWIKDDCSLVLSIIGVKLPGASFGLAWVGF